MTLAKPQKVFIFICITTLLSLYIVLPAKIFNWEIPRINFKIGSLDLGKEIELKQGLDIKGGLQVTLTADMKEISVGDRSTALESVKTVMNRRIDLFGVSEAGIKTAVSGNDYRLIIELPGVTNPQQALDLIGQTANLVFALPIFTPGKTASEGATLTGFSPTDLTGADLARASVTFETQDRQPGVSISFKDSGKTKFSKLTKENLGKPIAILLDGYPVTMPTVQVEITDGNAQITGKFTTEEAKALAVQLNAGALPVPVSVLSQKNIPATLGAESIQKSITAGAIGLFMVIFFMIGNYGWMGVIASIGLVLYGLFTLALYKVFSIVLSLPGIAGFLLSVGMAVDSNILIFERYKEEIRAGRPWRVGLELGFGRAWDSIKDANTATIITGLILLNPLDMKFLNTSGSVKGFALTLILGIFISLFTGIVVTRNLLRLFYKGRTLEINKSKTI
jgi:preprotein translocase subunit SecD